MRKCSSRQNMSAQQQQLQHQSTWRHVKGSGLKVEKRFTRSTRVIDIKSKVVELRHKKRVMRILPSWSWSEPELKASAEKYAMKNGKGRNEGRACSSSAATRRQQQLSRANVLADIGNVSRWHRLRMFRLGWMPSVPAGCRGMPWQSQGICLPAAGGISCHKCRRIVAAAAQQCEEGKGGRHSDRERERARCTMSYGICWRGLLHLWSCFSVATEEHFFCCLDFEKHTYTLNKCH